MKKIILAFAILSPIFSLNACAPIMAQNQGEIMPQNPNPNPNATCHADSLQYLVGQNRKVLETMRFGGEVRFEEPGHAYTMDYRENRLRIIIGEDGIIKSVLCG